MAKSIQTGFTSWEDVDAAIRELGEYQNQVTEIELELNRQQAELKKAAGEQAAPLQERIKGLTADIRKFVNRHKKELDGKSRELNHGTTGFRKSRSCVIPSGTEGKVARMLKKLDMLDCVKITEKVNRDVLKSYPDAVVSQTGAYIKTSDTFWVKPKHDKLKNSK